MSVDSTSFLITYPEFAGAPTTLIDAKLAEARTLVYGPVWNADGSTARDLTDQAVGLYTAAFLFDSPYSRHMARTDEGDAAEKNRSDANPYRIRVERLKLVVSSGFRVC